MAEKKMTAREFYEAIVNEANEGVISEELGTYAKSAIEKIDSRAAKSSSKKAEEYRAIWDKIKDVLTTEPQTAGEITAAINKTFNTEYNIQKITPALSRLASNGGCVIKEIKIKGRKANGYAVLA